VSTKFSLWRGNTPLVLASGSAARRALLEAAGIPLEILRITIDEAGIAETLVREGKSPASIAAGLALAKSENAAKRLPDRILLAADQTLDHAGTLLMKARSREQARKQLASLANSEHFLHSAAILRLNERVLWSGMTSARLRMRQISDSFFDAYLDVMGDAVLDSVGGYQLEALGIHLFEEIEGDHPTILGLPLLPLLQAMRQHGFLLA
jgi:septum formation protein